MTSLHGLQGAALSRACDGPHLIPPTQGTICNIGISQQLPPFKDKQIPKLAAAAPSLQINSRNLNRGISPAQALPLSACAAVSANPGTNQGTGQEVHSAPHTLGKLSLPLRATHSPALLVSIPTDIPPWCVRPGPEIEKTAPLNHPPSDTDSHTPLITHSLLLSWVRYRGSFKTRPPHFPQLFSVEIGTSMYRWATPRGA